MMHNSISNQHTSSAVFYVSPDGNDTHPGTLSQPFATLHRAQIAQRNAQSKGAVTVYLRGGSYYLTKPIVFTSKDSGTAKSPLVYQAYQSEKPSLHGSVKLSLTWTPYQSGILQARVPDSAGDLKIDQLFVNGQVQQMARYPNYDPKAQYYHGSAADAISPDRVKTWKNPIGAYVHGLHANHWGSYDYHVTDVDAGTGNLTLEGGWQNNRPGAMHASARFVENVLEELDAPGEWYFDHAKRVLYWMPPIGVDAATALVEASVNSSLIEFQGTPQAPVRFVSLKGLRLTQTSRTFMETREPLVRSDWRIYRGGAAFLQGTEDCHIQDCDFTDIGGNAVFFSNYNRRSSVSGCKIADIGASGICFVGDPNAARSPLFEYDQSQDLSKMDHMPGPKSDNYPAQCSASDNLITRIGSIEIQSAGVEIDLAQDITVRHCSIYDMPRAGINIGDGCWGGHLIEYCDVFDTVKQSGDHGSFNSWGRDRFWHPDRLMMDKSVADHLEWVILDAVKPITLNNNRWVCHHGWDIDLDDGSSHYIITNNLCLNGGIKNREGAFRRVENNVIVNNSFHPHVWFANSQDVFARNIVGTDYQPVGMPSAWGKQINHNLLPDDETLAQSQAAGRDLNSVCGDPLFVNPAMGDYRVKEGSPALKVGFHNFPMDAFGVTSPKLKAQAKNGLQDVGIMPIAAKRDAAIYLWLGAHVKTVTDLGEQSAAGLPNISGVMLVDSPADSPAAKAGFAPLDVIWTLNGQPISDYATLNHLIGSKLPDQQARFEVYRGQKLVSLSAEILTMRVIPETRRSKE